ncbi:hypothetical protein [Massilia sp. YIM B02443]|uniref:DUF7668 domain-containing protein n=1 Tax=Massilia sp. YIM B02443 TaxID=3050127 RepID=UPI0025B695E9|nr:hypothetical protein [Massilia sp. YIM B02443]MDN4037290.1 hypothetical protein [Massilia sp. YIM B02443]
MSDMIPISKDEHNQQPVPSAWRPIFVEIVEAFKDGDFNLIRGVKTVRPVSEKRAKAMTDNIVEYGARLVSLPENTWQTSVCIWMLDYWEVLVDLYTMEEGASDLVLHMRVYEEGPSYTYEVVNVYVP